LREPIILLFTRKYNLNKLNYYIEKLLLITIIGFVGNYIWNNLADFNYSNITINYIYFSISLFSLLLLFCFQGFIWSRVLNSNSQLRIPLSSHIRIFVYSQFGKYVPGKIMSYAILINLYQKMGYSKKEIVIASYYDLISGLLATVLFLFTSLLLFKPSFWNLYYDYILYLMIISLLAGANPKILNIILSKVLTLLKREQFTISLRYKDLMIFVLLYTANLFIWGIAFFLLVRSLMPIALSNYFYLSFSFALSAFLGFISIVAPAGIGVREGTLIALLKTILSANIASVISIVSRIWMIVAEILLFLIVLTYDKLKNHTNFGNLLKESKTNALEPNDQ